VLVAALVKPVCSTVKRLLDRTAKRLKTLVYVCFLGQMQDFLSRVCY
jgi:hypothetical protein